MATSGLPRIKRFVLSLVRWIFLSLLTEITIFEFHIMRIRFNNIKFNELKMYSLRQKLCT